MKKYILGIIGAGFMSSAIINGIIQSKAISPKDIIVSDHNDYKLNNLSALGINTSKNNIDIAKNSEFVLFAIKPQSFQMLCEEIKNINIKKIISIMAGVKKDRIKKFFPGSKVVRCMPNTPCSIGQGAVGINITDFTEEKDINLIKSIFSPLGSISYVKEQQINTVTGISGSSPAYFYYFIKSLVESGIENGLSYDESLNLCVNTMIGSGQMILNNKDKSLDDLITAVCSKGGTTIKAIDNFNNNNLNKTIKDSVKACIDRAKELENLS